MPARPELPRPVAGAPWAAVPGTIGPGSAAVWNRLSVAQLDAIEAIALRRGTVSEMVAATGGDRVDIVHALERRGLDGLARP